MRNAEKMGINPQNIYSYCPMWEAAGETIHDYGKLGSLTASGGVWDANRLYLTFDYATNTSVMPLTLGTAKYTIIASFTQDYIEQRGIFGCNTFVPGLFMYADSYFGIYHLGGKTKSTTTVPAGTLANIACTRHGTGTNEGNYYVDGVPAGTFTHSNPVPTLTVLDWGAAGAGQYPWRGFFDFGLFLVNESITADQAALFFDSPFQLVTPNPASVIFDLGAAPSTVYAGTYYRTLMQGQTNV